MGPIALFSKATVAALPNRIAGRQRAAYRHHLTQLQVGAGARLAVEGNRGVCDIEFDAVDHDTAECRDGAEVDHRAASATGSAPITATAT